MTTERPQISIAGFIATAKEYAEIRKRAEDRGATSAIARLDASTGEIVVEYHIPAPKFDRIRRITGYLVGTLDRFNNAKRAEEHDRIKHN